MSLIIWWIGGMLLTPPLRAESVETLVERHIEARGGWERLRSVRTLRASGTMRLAGRTEATFSLVWKRPRHARVDVRIRGQAVLQVLDGEQGFWVAPLLGMPDPVPLPEETVGQLARGVDFEGPLVDHARKGHRVQLLGQESVNGTAAWKLEVTTPDGTLHVFLDAERFLEIQEVRKEPATGLDLETTFSDYRSVEGLLIPHQLTSTLEGNPMDTTVIESIELNVPVDDAEFRKPASVSP
jgi:hypothetical protein